MQGNMYEEYRKEAAKGNDKLNSRAGAAELLGISESSLSHYENGITKTVPVDVVVMMADTYKAPELRNLYCKRECPIGKYIPMATESSGVYGATVKVLHQLDPDGI